METFLHVFIHSLTDSLKTLIVITIFYVLLSFFEGKLSSLLSKNKNVSPFFGALFGLIPQCGFSVVASDMFIKQHITLGTLLAVFISTSDEALPILLSNPDKIASVIPLLVIKFCLAIATGYIDDLILIKRKREVHDHHDHCHHKEEIHIGCCHHEIDNLENSKIKTHLIHPLIHSLKVFIYIFVINFCFGLLIEYIGEDQIKNFLIQNKYLSPLFCTLLGLIPNCASSVIIVDLFLLNGIPFSSCLAGLIVNAGLGTIYLIKNKTKRKETFIILSILISLALVFGYSLLFINL